MNGMDENYHFQFDGLARLYSPDILGTLSQAHICVVGLGGVGSWTAEALVRSGIVHFTLVDFDEICLSNTNRQVHAVSANVGQSKTTAMKERLLAIHPAAKVRTLEIRFDADTVDRVLDTDYDFVVDATDGVWNKCLLISECRKRGLPVVTTGGSGGHRDPTKIVVHDLNQSVQDRLLFYTRKRLRADFNFPRPAGKKREPLGIGCVYAPEEPFLPEGEDACFGRLNCHTGLGTGAFFTGSVGFAAAWWVVDQLSKPLQRSDVSK